MSHSLFMAICTWVLLWIVTWRIFYKILNKRHIDHIQHYWITSTYFFITTIVMYLLFQKEFALFINNFVVTPFYFLFFFYICAIVIYFLSQKRFVHVIAHWKQTRAFTATILMDHRFLVSKSCDILFQQTMVVLLIAFLSEQQLSLFQIMIVFTSIFGISHIPAIMVNRHKPAWYLILTIGGFCSGMIFPAIITTIHYGFVYTYIIHWCFYILIGIIINIRKKRELLRLAV